ncbi:hypothetical protein KY290_015316 [Solanum tuberosum]|uniref:Xyloglucan galactosyltransferase KATAMARI1 n=2 Tax=Solanum tuberosum TaxID=4113 RepID=M1CBY0_SOLTU|nr:PREDICTED: xyloglucan galactosyltransferase KATAMARI1 homolog [Solanum tuberosum]KAH0697448.1 hypothetical protein KY289_014930 [Solanum tuberosum]KAH0771335.1 hypothetical protein KY290_015316 [Solanum tuberosum]
MLPPYSDESPDADEAMRKPPKANHNDFLRNAVSNFQYQISTHPRFWLFTFFLFFQLVVLIFTRNSPFPFSVHSPPSPLPQFPSEIAVFPDIQTAHHDANVIYPFGDSECEYGRVYVYNLPSKFNKDLALLTCDDLDPWKWQCGLVTNDGYGKRSTELAGILPGNLSAAWYRTNQFSLEVIFHYRLLNYRCRTNDPESATAFYIPFYAGQAVGKYLWTDEIENRDLLSNKLLKWVQRQKYWKKYKGLDHFLTLGRITWDFRRLGDPEKLWGSSFLNRPQMQNVTRFTIEKAPWDANDIGVPYPTGFHPHSEKELREWQNFVLSYNRSSLFTFIGAARGDIDSDFRSRLMSYCRNESDSCRVVDCAVIPCSNGSSEIQKALLSSDFCLQPKGDSLTRRSVFDCMVAGSVPVFFWRRTAYTQYQWFLPEDPGSYSVFIDPEAVRNGTASIKEILKSYSKDQVRKMREKVVETIPRIVYARPSGGLGSVKDAFEIAIEGVLKRVKDENEWKEYVDMGS